MTRKHAGWHACLQECQVCKTWPYLDWRRGLISVMTCLDWRRASHAAYLRPQFDQANSTPGQQADCHSSQLCLASQLKEHSGSCSVRPPITMRCTAATTFAQVCFCLQSPGNVRKAGAGLSIRTHSGARILIRSKCSYIGLRTVAAAE